MTTIGLIVVSVLFAKIVAPLLSLLLFPLIGVVRALRPVAPILKVLLTALPMAGAMYLFVLLLAGMGREPNVLMFLVPFLLVLFNDLDRIHRAWTGDTPIRTNLERQGETYDPAFQAKLEIGSLVGDTLGLWLVFLLV